jgi:hypothetical protein
VTIHCKEIIFACLNISYKMWNPLVKQNGHYPNFGLHHHCSFRFTSFIQIAFKLFNLKYNWKWFSYNIYANNMDIHALSCSVMECMDLELIFTRIIVPPYFSQLMLLIHRNSQSMQVSTHVDCTFMLHLCITTLHLLGKGLSHIQPLNLKQPSIMID